MPNFNLPSEWRQDWPARTGPVDLAIHDLPHDSSACEWWYFNSHLTGTEDSGRELSVFASFFRIITGFDATKNSMKYAHAVIWAISDETSREYHGYSLLDAESTDVVLAKIDKETDLDRNLRKSLKEVLQQGNLPRPDMAIEGNVEVSRDKLFLDFGGNLFWKDAEGNYHAELVGKHAFQEKGCRCDLVLTPKKAPVRSRSDGAVETGFHGEEMFYYFITRNSCEGSVSIGDEAFSVTGTAWYDHEFGGTAGYGEAKQEGSNEGLHSDNKSWEWLSVQLDNEMDLTACNITAPNNGDEMIDSYVITIDADGDRIEQSMPSFKEIPGKVWRSPRTFIEYATEWTLKHNDIDLKLSATLKDQEIQTIVAFPSFWEGRVKCEGTIAGKPVSGIGFMEIHGRGRDLSRNLKSLFEASAQEMRKKIREVMPLESDPEGKTMDDDDLLQLVGKRGFDALSAFPEDLGRESFVEHIITPLRDTYDRGGKAWRSQALLVCIEAVGGNSGEFTHLLSVPEFLHAGSLIIDDIQDKSLTRRGKKCCHLIYGEEMAINAGCYSYFVGPALYKKLPDDKRLKAQDLYFATMLAGHVGQGADIAGLSKIMPKVVSSGKSKPATDSIIGIHRMKSGIPVRHMAQTACIIGDGTSEQIEVVGDFFEAIGVAFQIVDDVVNLQGFDNASWKTCGEDIMEGKVTFPIAVAFGNFDKSKREQIWSILESKPKDLASVKLVADAVRGTGALQESYKIAVDMVEKAWKPVDEILPDSFSKVSMRASSLFVLDMLKGSKPLPDSYF